MSNIRHLGRFKTSDGRTADIAEKMELARFPGHHVIAEREEGGDLVVYQIGDDDGLGVLVSGATGDRSPVKTLTDLQRVYDAKFKRPDTLRKLNQQSINENFVDRARAK
jgi:hypothetical protein